MLVGEERTERYVKKLLNLCKKIIIQILPNADEKIYEIRDEKYYLNLWEVNTQILKEFGVLKSNIINMNICTSCNCDRFFSYRKHEKTPKRIGTFIEIK